MDKLEGKIAWVTGAGSGIGEAGAVALAAEGATVVLSGRRRDALEAVAERINASGRGKAIARPADVTKAAAVGKLVEAIGTEHGRLDILVNNAGTNIPDRDWTRLSPEGIDTVIAGNLTSAFYVVRAVLPMMRAQKGGVMIHTASWAGRFIGPISGPAYTAAKHGMVAMSHTINLEECMNGIRSSVHLPGRGGDADPPEPADPRDARDDGAHGSAAGHGGADRLHRPPARPRLHQRGADQPDAQPRLCRHDAGAAGGARRTPLSPAGRRPRSLLRRGGGLSAWPCRPRPC